MYGSSRAHSDTGYANRNEDFDRPRRPANKPLAWVVEERIPVYLHIDLAAALACLIMDSGTENEALLSLGHKLQSMTD